MYGKHWENFRIPKNRFVRHPLRYIQVEWTVLQRLQRIIAEILQRFIADIVQVKLYLRI